jgi:hypothetical protein
MTRGLLLVPVLAGLVLTGCINASTLIKVKQDGSGTLEQAVLMNAQAFRGMFSAMGADGKPAQVGPSTINEADLKAAAAKLGEGVTFVSATPMKNDAGFEGVKAIYAFTDITKLQIDQDPNLSGASGGVQVQRKASKPVVFKMAKGANGTSVLTANFTDMQERAEARAQEQAPAPGQMSPDMVNPQMLEMAKAMFAGFHVLIDLEVAGQLVKSSSEYTTGNKVTLLEMDLGELLQDEAKLKEIQAKLGPNPSVAELKPYLAGVKGLKMNEPVVTIEFK